MSWIALGKQPKKGTHNVIVKLPVINVLMIGKFVDGELQVIDQANGTYVSWNEVLRNIEWRPLSN